MKKNLFLGLLLFWASTSLLFSQTATSNIVGTGCVNKTNLVCAFANLYGPGGLTLPNSNVGSQFVAAFNTAFAGTATQITQLPTANIASGFVYEFDADTGLYVRSSDSLGPMLADRGETVGRHKIVFGTTFQRFRMNTLDGVNLHNFPVLFPAATKTIPAGDPALASQFISARYSLSGNLNEFNFFVTYGITNRIEVSAVIPYVQLGYNLNSIATINRTLLPDGGGIGTEPILSPGANGGPPTVGCCSNGGPGPYGPVYANFFDPANPAGSTVREFSNNKSTRPGSPYYDPSNNSAGGIGDVEFRAKFNVYRSENIAVAAIADFHFPTGDPMNYLGVGTYEIRPMVAASIREGWITPHVNLGYQFFGDSVLAGDPYLGTKAKLPGYATYTVGADIPLTKFLTFSTDYLGRTLVDSPRFGIETVQSPAPLVSTGQVQSFQTVYSTSNQVYNESDFAAGAKLLLFDHFLVSGSVIVGLNTSGLREERVMPVVGVSYVF